MRVLKYININLIYPTVPLYPWYDNEVCSFCNEWYVMLQTILDVSSVNLASCALQASKWKRNTINPFVSVVIIFIFYVIIVVVIFGASTWVEDKKNIYYSIIIILSSQVWFDMVKERITRCDVVILLYHHLIYHQWRSCIYFPSLKVGIKTSI